MKRLFVLAWLLALLTTSLFAQDKKKMTQDEAVKFAKYLVDNKRLFLHNPAEKLYYTLETAGFPIRHMSTTTAGPWGEERTKGVIFYDVSSSDIDTYNPPVLILEVKLEMDLNNYDFWHNTPDEKWMEYIMEKTKHYVVNDIRYEVSKIYPEDSPAVKKIYKSH